jgi:uncharacterized protein
VGPPADRLPSRFPIDPGTQRWGLGDVAAGIFTSMLLATFVGGLILSIMGWTGDVAIPIWGLALLQIPLWGGYLGVTLLATTNKGTGLTLDLGLRSTGLDALIGLAIGVLTQLILLPLLYLPILELTGTSPDELSAPARELAGRAGDLPGWILFAVIVGLGAPLVEEIFYRGLFLRALQKRGMGSWPSVLVSSAVFAAVHFQVLQFVGLLVFGLVAGALTVRSGRLGPAIWAHVGFNMTTVLVLYQGMPD